MKSLFSFLALTLTGASWAAATTHFECHSRQNGLDLYAEAVIDERDNMSIMVVDYKTYDDTRNQCSGSASKFNSDKQVIHLLRCETQDRPLDLILTKLTSGWHLTGKAIDARGTRRSVIPDYFCKKVKQ